MFVLMLVTYPIALLLSYVRWRNWQQAYFVTGIVYGIVVAGGAYWYFQMIDFF